MGNKDYALEVFRGMAFQQSILPEPATYSSLLHGLRMLSREDDISKMLKDMVDEGVYVDVRTFNIFVDAYCKEGRMEDAESLVKMMIQRRIGPTVVTYRWLIDGYCSQGNISKGKEVFDSMRRRDCAVYNSLINGYFRNMKIKEAMHLFNEMMKNAVKLNAVTYDTMGLFRFGSCTALQEHYSKLLIPNESTFKIVLEGLCNNYQIREAVSLFHSMGDNKLHSNLALYNILIEGAIKNVQLGIARTLYDDLIIKGLQPNAVTYAALIDGLFQEGFIVKARELFLEMKEKGFLPNKVTCNYLLRVFLKNQQIDIANMLLEMIERKDGSYLSGCASEC